MSLTDTVVMCMCVSKLEAIKEITPEAIFSYL